jgi:hypothetical protein
MVTPNDDSYELVEAKGIELPEYKLIELIWLPEHMDTRTQWSSDHFIACGEEGTVQLVDPLLASISLHR